MKPLYGWYYADHAPSAAWDGRYTRSIFLGSTKSVDGRNKVDVYLRAPYDGMVMGAVVWSDEPGDYSTVVASHDDSIVRFYKMVAGIHSHGDEWRAI